jgi:hypothetical protein
MQPGGERRSRARRERINMAGDLSGPAFTGSVTQRDFGLSAHPAQCCRATDIGELIGCRVSLRAVILRCDPISLTAGGAFFIAPLNQSLPTGLKARRHSPGSKRPRRTRKLAGPFRMYRM